MKRFLIARLLLAGIHTDVWAAPSGTPDWSTNPVLTSIQKAGAKLYYLGARFGMDGWFIVKDGQVQIAYSTPDNKGALVGALFGEDGENITSLQVGNLVKNNKEVADLIATAQKEQAAISQVGTPSAAASAPTSSTLPSTPLSPGERLFHDLSLASTVVVGNSSAPEIMMVMDPRCPHCQATWKALRESVTKGTIHIRMIPIGGQDTDNERAAAVFLGTSDPLTAWDKYVSGDFSTLAGQPSEAALAAIRANHAVIDNWSIKTTPYIVYRAKDGKIKIVMGEVLKIGSIFTDMGL